ncbi:uncharacterized protein LOC117609219 isoform X1 [Osmia lignaria lignaria]|uniref:uncharacterized protein LOC117609219 isoform X1 n=1 Tax=Osmia lignaria lignaria TaxID=1437193 RepID=UPI00402B8F43
MSCVHYQSSDPSRDRSYYDGQCNRFVSSSYNPRNQTADTYRSGYCAGWRMHEFQGNNVETPTPGKGEPTFSDPRIHTPRATYKQETTIHGDQLAIEKMQTKIKFLENSNIVMQTRNQKLITENKALMSRLEEEQDEVRGLEKKITSLQEELDCNKLKLEEMKKEAEASKKNACMLKANATSTTNIPRIDRGVQVWAVCMGCRKKLESCEKQPPTVTITKSELEVLEKDMQTLRDTIIAREEAWDKAMEREENYRQQLTRLTTETITARHLSETRHDELKTMTNALSEKESELKTLEKDNFNLRKLLAKHYNVYQRGQEGIEINEKDQRYIEEVARMTSVKSKQKQKSKSACSERTPHTIAHQTAISPRERSVKTMKDQTSSLRETKR